MKKKNFPPILLALVYIPLMSLVAQNTSEDKGMIPFPESPYMEEMRKKTVFRESSLLPMPSISAPFRIMPLFITSNVSKNNHILSDYNLLDTKELSNQFSIISFGQQATYLGLGAHANMGATLRWSLPKSKISIGAGGFAGTQNGHMLSSQQTIWGTNLNLIYEISPEFQLTLKGQYVNSSNINPFLYRDNLFPATNIGLFAEYRPAKNLSLGFGLFYLYEEMAKNWSPQGGIRIIFYF